MATVLLADDDAVLRDMYKMRLIREGFVVNEATDGHEVIEQAEKNRPDIILLDIMMPKMNGLDALKLLRTGEATAKIPVIIMTALAQDVSHMGSSGVQADSYISKSEILPDQVVERVKTVLAQAGNAKPQK